MMSDGKSRRLKVKESENLMKTLLRDDVKVQHPCKGKGKCGKCSVRISDWDGEAVPAPDVAMKKRLACLVDIKQPLAVWLLDKKTKPEKTTKVETPFVKVCSAVKPLGESKESSVWQHLLSSYSGKDRKVLESNAGEVLPRLTELLAPEGGAVTLTRFGSRFIDIVKGDKTNNRLGLSVIVDEKYICASLVEISSAAVLKSVIDYTRGGIKLADKKRSRSATNSNNAGIVNKEPVPVALRSRITEISYELCRATKRSAVEISDIVFAGDINLLGALCSKTSLRDTTIYSLPINLSSFAVASSYLGLEFAKYAAVWFPPAFSLSKNSGWLMKEVYTKAEQGQKIDLDLLSTRPESEAAKKVDLESPTEMLMGAINCLLYKKCRAKALELSKCSKPVTKAFCK